MANSSSQWIKAYSECELPVLYKSKYRLHQLQEDEQDITITILTDIARQDPGFAISLLRYAGQNTKKEITTLSHAISLISIPLVIKKLTDLPVLEKAFDQKIIAKIMQVYAYQYQNASMAREWSVMRKESETNEIFTAGLNRGFVRFMLYLIDPDKGIELEKVYFTPSDDHKQREKDVLGDSVDIVSETIAKKWKLPELIRESYSGKHHNPKITGIRLSAELMREIYTKASVNYSEELLTRIAEYMRVPLDEAPGKVNRIIAKTIRNSYKHLPIQPLLLTLMSYPESIKKQIKPVTGSDTKKKKTLSGCIKQLRLNNPQLTTKHKINIAVKAMHQGAGFSRVLFLSFDKKEHCLKLLGRMIEKDIPDIKSLSISLDLNKLFKQIVKKEQIITITAKNQHKYNNLLPDVLRPLKAAATMIISSLYINNRPVGCFCVDHGQTEKPLTSKDLQSYKFICKELKTAIESSLIKRQTTKKVA